MNYNLRAMNGKNALFFYTGLGKGMKTSFLYKNGHVALFEECEGIRVGDKIKLGHEDAELDGYSFEPEFVKAIRK